MRQNSSIVPNFEEMMWNWEAVLSPELLTNNAELLRNNGEMLRNVGEMLRNDQEMQKIEELLRKNEELLRKNEEPLRFSEEVGKLAKEEEARKLSEEEEAGKLSEVEEAGKLSEVKEAGKLSEVEEVRKLSEEEVTQMVEVIVSKGFKCAYCEIFMRNDKKFEKHVYGNRCQVLKKVIKHEANRLNVTEAEVIKAIIINEKRYPCNRCDFVSATKEELVVHLTYECKAASGA